MTKSHFALFSLPGVHFVRKEDNDNREHLWEEKRLIEIIFALDLRLEQQFSLSPTLASHLASHLPQSEARPPKERVGGSRESLEGSDDQENR